MAQINIRIDDKLKEKAEILFNELGLSMSTAFNIFVRQAVRQGGIPFEITTQIDPFYSEANMNVIKKSIREADEGKFVYKTIEELKAMEDESKFYWNSMEWIYILAEPRQKNNKTHKSAYSGYW